MVNTRFSKGDLIRLTDPYWDKYSHYFMVREGVIATITSTGHYMMEGEPKTAVDEHGAELCEGPW